MRTTLNVDDDVLERAKSIARFRKVSVGEALSELARKGMNTRIGTRLDPISGLMVFDVPAERRISLEDVQRLMDEDDREYVQRSLSK